AALHRAAARISAGAVALVARADGGARDLRRALYLELETELEPALLSKRHLVLQSAHLAAYLCVRCVVRSRGRRATRFIHEVTLGARHRGRVSVVLVPRGDDLVFPALCGLHSEMVS